MKTLLQLRTKVVAADVVVLVLLAIVATAQSSLHRKLVFSAPVTEAQCREFPSADFDLGPAGDRWKSKDLLNVRCGLNGHSPIALTLTFTIDANVPSGPRGVRGEVFRFYWGRSINTPSRAFTGQFTRNPDLCSRLAGLLNSRVIKFIPEDSARVHQIPELSSGCYGEDMLGTVMEIVLTSDFSDSPN